MSDDAAKKSRAEDASYVTIPPELRDFVPPKTALKGEKNPQLVATVEALKALNGGGEQADPFFFNTRGVATAVQRGEEGDEAKGAGNAKVHVPAFALPAAGLTSSARVAAEAAEITIEKAPAVAMVVAGASAEPTGSPWAAEPAVAMISLRDLPSALAPTAKTEPAPASVKAARAPVEHEGRLLRGGIALVVAAVLGFAAFQLVPREKTPEIVAAVPVASSAGAAVASTVRAAVPSFATPPAKTVEPAEVDAGAAVVPSAAVVPVPVKVKSSGGGEENIYDAAPPRPAKTVEPVVAPPPSASAPVVPPTVTPKASSGPTPMFERGN